MMGTEKRQILIVDDVELNRAILAELFQDSYEVLEAENGCQALELLEAHHDAILIVLLDIIMPVMDGFEMLQNMAHRTWKEEIPVVLITSENSDNALLKGYELGVSDTIELYLHKRHLEALVRQQVETLEKQTLKLNRFNEFIIDTLSTVVEFRSCESGTHIRRVREITRLLLESLSFRYPEYDLPHGAIDKMVSAASMHDIGKIAIPDAVLNKPGRLTAEEFEIMKTHSLKGCELLQSINEERWDGSGYPDGLAGNNIPIWAQVVSLADVYDALTSERVYKAAYTHAQAVSMILNGECGVFNPRLLNSFLSVASRLENREIGPMFRERAAAPAKPSHKKHSLSARTLWLLEREREKYRVLSELSGDIVFNYDVKRDMLECSEKWYEVFGWDITVPNARKTLLRSSFIHEDDRAIVLKGLSGITPKHPRCRMEIRLMISGGGYEWFDVYANALWDADSGSRLGYLGKLTNINERKSEVNRWREQANTDPLTGLSNRKRIEEQIAQALEDDKENGAAFLFIDVDNFKAVNDTLGHMFGDEVLRHVASEIRRTVRTSDIVGRVGGDEFIVFLRNIRSLDAISKKAGEICAAFKSKYSEAIPHGGISCSVGIALYPGDGACYEDLMHKADQALYAAKEKGKNCFAFYDVTFRNRAFPSVLSEVESGA